MEFPALRFPRSLSTPPDQLHTLAADRAIPSKARHACHPTPTPVAPLPEKGAVVVREWWEVSRCAINISSPWQMRNQERTGRFLISQFQLGFDQLNEVARTRPELKQQHMFRGLRFFQIFKLTVEKHRIHKVFGPVLKLLGDFAPISAQENELHAVVYTQVVAIGLL